MAPSHYLKQPVDTTKLNLLFTAARKNDATKNANWCLCERRAKLGYLLRLNLGLPGLLTYVGGYCVD